MPRSIHSRTARASGTVLTSKMPGKSMPGSGGRTETAPGDSTSLSYDSVVISPVATLRRSIVFFLAEIEIASQFVRASIRKLVRKNCSLATSRLDSFSITPEM